MTGQFPKQIVITPSSMVTGMEQVLRKKLRSVGHPLERHIRHFFLALPVPAVNWFDVFLQHLANARR